MAYALLAGLPPIYGLYTTLIPLVIYALIGTSRQLSVGPVAMVALIVSGSLGALNLESEEYVSYALVLALMVGVIQFIMGLLNWGTIIRFIANPIISGFVSSAAIFIGFSQVSNLVGLVLPKNEPVFNILLSMFTHWEGISKLSLLIGIFFSVIPGHRRIFKKCSERTGRFKKWVSQPY